MDESNVIISIEVNGEVKKIVDKMVNITVPTKASDSDSDSGYKTEEDVVTAIAKIVDEAPKSLDALIEIADWIENHMSVR